MNFDRLRELILERAIQGKLVPQLESEPPVSQIECKYKNLPFKTPKKWGFANLADLIEFLDYGTSTKCHATKEVEDVPVLRMCNIENGTVNLENLKYANRDLIEISRPYLQYGDLIFNRTNSLELIGKCAPFLIDEKYSFASYLIRVRLKPTINAKYLSYWINSNICRQTQIYPKVSKQVGQANFSGSKLKQIAVPLPPIEEQLRIVSEIDDLFAKINLLESSCRELNELKKILRKLVLQKAIQGKLVPQLEREPEANIVREEPKDIPFNAPKKWKWVKFTNVATLLNGRAYSKSELLREAPGRVPVLRVGNFFTNGSWYYSDLKLEPNKYCDNNDLLFAWSASFGPKIWNGGRCIYHYHIWKVLCSEYVDKEWLYFWLLSMVDKLKNTSGRGSTMIHITKKETEQTPLALPPIEEQRRIVRTIKSLFRYCDDFMSI